MNTAEFLKGMANTLKLLRQANKLTQLEVAKYCAVHTRQYQRIEAGTANMTVDTMMRIINFFGFDLSNFCKFMEAMQSSTLKRKTSVDAFVFCEMTHFLIRYAKVNMIENVASSLKSHGHDIFFDNKKILDNLPFIVVQINDSLEFHWSNQLGFDFFGQGIIGSGGKKFYLNEEALRVAKKYHQNIFSGKMKYGFIEIELKNLNLETRFLCIVTFPVYRIVNVREPILTHLITDLTNKKKSHREMLELASNL